MTAEDHWLNSVLATPVLGVLIGAKPSGLLRVNGALAPFLDALHDETKEVTIKQSTGETSIETPDGFIHKFTRTSIGLNVTVHFRYAPEEQKAAGSLPTLSYRHKSFGETLAVSLARLRDMVRAMQALEHTSIRKFGLLAQAELTAAQLPPGVAKYRDWLSGPWVAEKATLVKSSGSVLVRWPTSKEDKFHDQCHHSLSFDTDEDPSEFTLTLDYQRVWKDGLSLTQFSSISDSFRKKSTEYFQDFAFGDRIWPST